MRRQGMAMKLPIDALAGQRRGVGAESVYKRLFSKTKGVKKLEMLRCATACLLVLLSALTIFLTDANAATIDDSQLPNYLREQKSGLFVGSNQISQSGYYNISDDGSLTTGDPDNYQIYADLENKTLTLNGAAITVETPLNNIVNSKPDPSQDPAGVLCETKGTATADSGTVFQVLNGYSLVTAGIAVLNDPGNWTLTLQGENSIAVDSKFAVPYRDTSKAMPVFGIYVPGGSLSISGSGSLDADVANNQQSRLEGAGFFTPACAIYANGLDISQAAVEVSISSTELEIPGYDMRIPGSNSTLENYFSGGYGAVMSTGDLTIEGNASVTVTDAVASSSGITAMGDIAISGDETNVTVTSKNLSSYAIGEKSSGSCTVTITGGTVTATAEMAGSYGISGAAVIIFGADTVVDVSASGESSCGINGKTVDIKEADVSASAYGEYGQAVSGTTVTLASGTYNTEIPESYLAEGAYLVDGVVTTEYPDDVTAFIGSNLFTGPEGGNRAIAALSVNGGEAWLKVDTTAGRSGLLVGNSATIYVAKGFTYSGSFTGDSVVASITLAGQETRDGVTYDKYIYEMLPDPATAPVQVTGTDGSTRYYNDLSEAVSSLEGRERITLLDDINMMSGVTFRDEDITLDLNGHTITVQSGTAVATYNYGNSFVTILDSSEAQTGGIIAQATNAAAFSGNGVIRGGTFNGSTCASGYSDLTIEGGTFCGTLKGKVKLYDGNFADITLPTSNTAGNLRTMVSLSGKLKGQTGADNLTWMVTPNSDTVTIDGEEWPGLTLTFSGSGAMDDYPENDRPWYSLDWQMTQVVVEEGVTRLGNNAFRNSTIESELKIPASLTDIGIAVFAYSDFTAFTVAEGSSSFSAEGGVLFNQDKTELVAYPSGAEPFVEYQVPSTVTSIKGWAFQDAKVLAILVPETLTDTYTPPSASDMKKLGEIEGYTFEGWYSDDSYSNVTSGNITTSAYAKWVTTVTFDPCDGTGSTTSQEAAYGKALSALPTNPTREGYEFVGWNTAADGSGTAVTKDTVPTGKVTYYGVWSQSVTVDDVTVSFVAIPDQVYTGSAIEPAVYYIDENGQQTPVADVTYVNNTAVGTATAKATVNGAEFTLSFAIVKATVDMSGVAFEGQTFSYDGQVHSLAVTGTLPDGVSVSYENNDQKDYGTYTVTAKFTVADAENNELIPDMKATLKISRANIKIVADNKSMYVGDPVPELTYTIVSLVTGQPVDDVELDFTPGLSCSADGTVEGSFAITVTGVSSKTYGNYTLYSTACENGTMTVSKRHEPVSPVATTYSVTVAEAENGEVSVDKPTAEAGEKVTVTATPAEGYEVASVAVTSGNQRVDVTDEGDGTYSFEMPAADVTVAVAFEASAPAVELPFTDVSDGDWYYGPVAYVYAKGLMTGYEGTTLFGPNDALGREQAAAVLFRALGAGAQAPAAGMADVDQGAWYAQAVNWAVASGLLTGYADGSGLFGVGDALTRDQFAAIVARVAGADLSKADPSALDGFSDGDAVAEWAVPAVSWAAQVGILEGSPDGEGGMELRSSAGITRGEMAAMIQRAAGAGLLPTA